MDRTQARRPAVRGRIGHRVVIAALALIIAWALAACGGQQEQRSAVNLCIRYQQLVSSVNDMKASVTGTPTADAVRRRAEIAQTRLDELRAATDGQYDATISTLQTAINDLKQSAANAGAAAAQARSDAVQALTQSLAPIKQRLEVQCGSTG